MNLKYATRDGVEHWLVHSTKFIVSTVSMAIVLFSPSWYPFCHVVGASTNGLISHILKEAIQQPRPWPYAKDGYGMPSSHAQVIFYFVSALWIEGLYFRALTTWWPMCGLLLLTVYLIAASYSRVSAGYHTLAQVSTGAILGVIIGVMSCHVIRMTSLMSTLHSTAPSLTVKLALCSAITIGLYGRKPLHKLMTHVTQYLQR